MPLRVNTKFADCFIENSDYENILPELQAAHNMLVNGTGKGGADRLGWLDLPVSYDRDEVERIKQAAAKIKSDSKAFIVIGIGGSYLGARAAIELLSTQNYNLLSKDTPNIYFSGNSFSSASLEDLVTICKNVDFSINVISKSGTTTETAIAFRIFRDILIKRYGEKEAAGRIYITTDKEEGALKKQSDEKGYTTFSIPRNVGGRYSVLTAVGLFPIAVAGINIEKLLQGAALARDEYSMCDIENNPCYRYAAIRNILYRKGKKIEILASYESSFSKMCEWYKQLFGESEGKDGKGLFPSSAIYSTDLHSIGQYIQQGERHLFETVVQFEVNKGRIVVEEEYDDVDELNYLAGNTMSSINEKALIGSLIAHHEGGVPNIIIQVPNVDEINVGRFIFFFEKACAVSGYILGVNPFDQPGVEDYKNNMFALLKKPGYEDRIKNYENYIRLLT